MSRLIIRIIDFFYPPFSKLMPVSFFRYGVCGVGNMCFDWVLYFVVYNFVLRKQIFDLGFIAFSPHIAALLITFPIVLLTGFYLSSNVSFQGSSLRGRIQLFRYLCIVAVNLLINYFCLKVLVDFVGIYPTPSKMITTIFTTLFSYFAQKHYSFKKDFVLK